jgi:hypothetical protein
VPARDCPSIMADNLISLKLLALQSYITVLPHSSGLSCAPSFQSNRTVIHDDRKSDACSRSIAPPTDVGLVIFVPHGSYCDLVAPLQPMP